MKTKSTILCIAASVMLLTINPTSLMATDDVPTITTEEKAQESETMQLRLAEINAMDKSDLSRTEKKELRKEVKAIEAASSNGGVYLSVGAIIIIVLLLILLL